jgi:hypothetical protein
MPVVPGDWMDIAAKLLKLAVMSRWSRAPWVLGETVAAARGRLAFARRTFE